MTGHPLGGHGMQVARVFDGPGPGGRPTVHRPPVGPEERDKVLAYLESAVAVFSAPGGYKPDVYDPGAPAGVPEKFYTDGTWVWPADVYFYLRKHQIPPEPDLVAHIRAQKYQVPEVDEAQRAIATALATGAPPPMAPPPSPVSPPHATSPGFPAQVPPPPSYGYASKAGPPPVGGPAPGYPPGGAAPAPQKSGMSGGAIAGLVIGGIVLLLILCCCGGFFLGIFDSFSNATNYQP